MRRIIVGVDGSDESVAALRWACREAALRGAEVHAVHVRESRSIPSYGYAARAVSRPGDSEFPVGDEELRSLQSDQEPRVKVRAETVTGLPARVLLDLCDGADMLVLGTSGDTPGPGRSAGPVIRACLRRAPCPVVVISAAQALAPARDAASAEADRIPVGAGIPAALGV
jgi:nucleotide-binding universal stress UspA family protein